MSAQKFTPDEQTAAAIRDAWSQKIEPVPVPTLAEAYASMASGAVCRECQRPSVSDVCETCAEVGRILAMSDDEILAESSDEELGWARGFKEGLRIGLMASKQQSAQSKMPSAYQRRSWEGR